MTLMMLILHLTHSMNVPYNCVFIVLHSVHTYIMSYKVIYYRNDILYCSLSSSDMREVEKKVRTIECDGLLWGACESSCTCSNALLYLCVTQCLKYSVCVCAVY